MRKYVRKISPLWKFIPYYFFLQRKKDNNWRISSHFSILLIIIRTFDQLVQTSPLLYFLLYNCNHPFSIEHQKGGGKVGRTGIKARTARFSRHELYAHVHVGMQGWCKGRSYISQAPAFVPLHSWLRSWIAVGSRENSRLPVSDRTEYTRGSLSPFLIPAAIYSRRGPLSYTILHHLPSTPLSSFPSLLSPSPFPSLASLYTLYYYIALCFTAELSTGWR